jgi:hypothetical protein
MAQLANLLRFLAERRAASVLIRHPYNTSCQNDAL